MAKKHTILITLAKENTGRKDISDVLRCKKSICKILSQKKTRPKVLFVKRDDFNAAQKLKKTILNKKPSCIFNLFEGFSDEPSKEAEFVKILETLEIPFTGNSSFTLNSCLDKAKAKRILKAKGIKVADGVIVKNIKKIKMPEIKFPVFVKPRFEDASVGINRDSLVFNQGKLLSLLKTRLNEFPAGLLVESFLPGKEYSVAFLGNGPYEVLGISTIDYSRYKKLPHFLTYASKWDKMAGEFKKILPYSNARIGKKLKIIINKAQKAATALGCRGYFRVDLREKNGYVFVIDVNPNPDINCDSGYIKQACKKGYSYAGIIEKIINLAGA